MSSSSEYSQEVVLQAVQNGARSTKEIAKIVGLHRDSVMRHLNDLMMLGKVVRFRREYYAEPERVWEE